MISWEDVERVLKQDNCSENFIARAKALFVSPYFQALALEESGVITNITFDFDGKVAKQSLASIGSLGDMDIFDLEEFVSSNELTYRQAESITTAQMDLLTKSSREKVCEALSEEDDENFMRFSLAAIVNTGFPFRKIKGPQHYERKNGNLTLTLTAPNEIGLPTGMLPRLIFIHICSEVVKSGEKRIQLGRSLKSFVVDVMQRPWSTGKNGSAQRWRRALISLLGTHMTITDHRQRGDGEGVILEHASIVDRAEIWWDKDFDLEEAFIEVNDRFADVLVGHAVPLHRDALLKLAEESSPLAIDLYCWLTYRIYKLEKDQKQLVRIRWEELMKQTGTSQSIPWRFRIEVIKAMKLVSEVYPQASVNCDDKRYIRVYKGTPHVRPPTQKKLEL